MNKIQKQNMRHRDRTWFKKNLPFAIWYMREIHHDWDSKEKWCYLISHDDHVIIEKEIKMNTQLSIDKDFIFL